MSKIQSTSLNESLVEGPDIDHGNQYIFKWLCLISILTTAQGGAVPSMLESIKEGFNLSFVQQGLLGGAVYIGLSLCCPITGYLFRKFNIKSVLSVSLLLFTVALICFSSVRSGNPEVLIVTMGMMGIFQAFIMVFSPVWIDAYAPNSRRTKWISIYTAMTAFGIMVGYINGAITTWIWANHCPHNIMCWRIPFMFQALCLLPIVIFFFFIPVEHLEIDLGSNNNGDQYQKLLDGDAIDEPMMAPGLLDSSLLAAPAAGLETTSPILQNEKRNSNHSRQRSRQRTKSTVRRSSALYNMNVANELKEENVTRARLDSAFVYETDIIGDTSRGGWFDALCDLFSNPIFSCVVFALSGLYYVVTGVQYWATEYLITEVGGNRGTVHILFIIVSATGPIMGVFLGGALVDSLGGYKKAPIPTLNVCVLFGLCAACCGLPVTFVDNMYVVVFLLWGLLFFGGGTVPCCTGLFISSVSPDTRAFASSVSVIIFNLLGYGLSPVSSSIIMNATNSFRIGFRICLFCSLIPVSLMFFAWRHAKKINYKGYNTIQLLKHGNVIEEEETLI